MSDQDKLSNKAVSERDALIQIITALEQENKSIEGQIKSAAPEVLLDLKAKNKELKSALLLIEKELALELLRRKIPLDVGGISDKLQILKAEILDYCEEKKLDPSQWKKLESL
jgi:hypothetical protein